MKDKVTYTRAALCVLMAIVGVWGRQPTPVGVSVESILSRRGDSFLRLRNNTRESQTLKFEPGSAASAIFKATNSIVLSPNAMLDINVGVLKISDGIQVLHAASTVTLAGGGTVPGPQLYEVLEVSSTGIVKTTYERAFLSKRLAISGPSVPLPVDIGGGYIDTEPIAKLAFPLKTIDPSTPYQRINEVTTYEMSKIPLRQLPEDGGAEGDTKLAPATFARSMDRSPLEFGASAKDRAPQPQAGSLGNVRGWILVKVPGANDGDPDIYQTAHGWKVRVWQLIFSQWMQLASTSVTGDGDWSVDFAVPPMPGVKLRIEIQPANRFVRLRDADANTYTWSSEVMPNIGGITDAGFGVVDLTKTGSAPGIDRIFQGAMALWRKFKKFEMSAKRDEPIKVTYPNKLSTGECQDVQNGVAIAWSCAHADDGELWLIAGHASPVAVQHELAHTIHSYYWDGDLPDGSGGTHSLKDCDSAGIGLSEGFANFMPFWVQFEPTANNPNLGSISIDSPGSGFCFHPNNEVRVAATFWDAYDKVNGGNPPLQDGWSFTKPWAPVSTFLKNSDHDSIEEFNAVYKNILGYSWETAIDYLFLLNGTILPY